MVKASSLGGRRLKDADNLRALRISRIPRPTPSVRDDLSSRRVARQGHRWREYSLGALGRKTGQP